MDRKVGGIGLSVELVQLCIFKVTGIRPMAPVQTEVHLNNSEHMMLLNKFFGKEKKYWKCHELGSYFIVQSRWKRARLEFIANSQSRIIILPLIRNT